MCLGLVVVDYCVMITRQPIIGLSKSCYKTVGSGNFLTSNYTDLPIHAIRRLEVGTYLTSNYTDLPIHAIRRLEVGTYLTSNYTDLPIHAIRRLEVGTYLSSNYTNDVHQYCHSTL